ncbi:SMEK domain-containing protein [Stenotrophomonas sp.]|uniref:SMEK domain-containing protein n=1 Tax=Stenotrophomonas sp. TaxID=69392 RepID=UPI0028A90ECC|nr:SMEK domain-containing protein [Stenotrophomonas sp.]
MITRGYFIGQIIDELTAVSQQVKSRAGLQLFDLNRYLEDFFKDILNIVYGYKLINLNEERSNNPGLDLGDEVAKVAFQVTSTKTSGKVNKTLEKAANQVGKFPTIFVLVLQDKQGSYTLDTALAKPFNFVAEEHVLDIGDVLKKVLSLPIEQLQSLHDLVSKEVARVKIELEVPDKNGKFQTNIDAFIEQIPRERFEGIGTYYQYLVAEAKKEKATCDISEEDVEIDFKNFIEKLKRLPRISRQFYAFLLDRGEWHETRKFINADYLTRVCSFPDMHGELRLLSGADLCDLQESDGHGESAIWRIATVLKAKSYEFTWEFMGFLKQKKIGLEKVIVSLDFSDLK